MPKKTITFLILSQLVFLIAHTGGHSMTALPYTYRFNFYNALEKFPLNTVQKRYYKAYKSYLGGGTYKEGFYILYRNFNAGTKKFW